MVGATHVSSGPALTNLPAIAERHEKRGYELNQ
jgi:hypothetical protein